MLRSFNLVYLKTNVVYKRYLPTIFHTAGTNKAAKTSFTASPSKNGVKPHVKICAEKP